MKRGIRRLREAEENKAEGVVHALLLSCWRKGKGWWASDPDYAEAHGYVRALKDANFYEGIEMNMLTRIKADIERRVPKPHEVTT